MRHAATTGILLLTLIATSASVLAQERLDSTLRSADDDQGTDVLGTFVDSLKLLMIEHGTRVAFQDKTRRELGGNFWRDYGQSVRMPAKWEDSDGWWVNYIGHPIHGAAAGYLWLDHSPGDPAEISLSSKYWASRARATAWAAGYSLQFEVGPLSEASIGNVGLMDPRRMAWGDLVITPTLGTAWMVGEDLLDQRVLARRDAGNAVLRNVVRTVLNPSRSGALLSSGKWPWYRVRDSGR